MAITSFIPQIWEARLMANFYERSIAGLIATAPVQIAGNKVVFNKVGDIEVKDYAGSMSFDGLTTEAVEMDMDIQKYWGFKVNDVEKVQAAGELIDVHTAEAASKMAAVMDGALLDKAMAQGATIEKGELKAYDLIVKCNTALNKNKVPKTDRYAVINAEALEELNLDARFTEHYQILENGIIEGGNINGTQLVYCEELNDGKYAIMVSHKSALGFGTQLDNTEAIRLQDDFADGVRGLQVAGAAVLRPEGIAHVVGL